MKLKKPKIWYKNKKLILEQTLYFKKYIKLKYSFYIFINSRNYNNEEKIPILSNCHKNKKIYILFK